MGRTRSFAALSLARPLIMGIVNVTPDSFSDGGDWMAADAAIDHGRRLADEGADIIDVGGESTRPGAQPVPIDEECRRVVPVIRALAADGLVVSVDTRHAAVMAAAIEGGARIVNDVSALTGDAASLPLVARTGVSVVLMHMRGEPASMQRDPQYNDVAGEIDDWLASRVGACRRAGIPAERIAVDPGIGFGKTLEHNLALLADLGRFRALDGAVLIGVSRKSFIARLSRDEPPTDRLGGSLAAALAAVARGCDIVRVHDVAPTRQALTVWAAIAAADARRCAAD